MSLARIAIWITTVAVVYGADATIPGAGNTLVAHEWGTFTSVADADGSAVVWGVLGGKADLPCFVNRSSGITKAGIFSRVRMETPVIYFYSPKPATVSVHVEFPTGVLTEWYPQAHQEYLRVLDWKNVQVLPDAEREFPGSKGGSHYYAARETDSAPLRVGGQAEKLLFYRGAGDFQPPVKPRFKGPGMLEMDGAHEAILFENRGGKVGWRTLHGAEPVAPPELKGDLAELRAALVTMLTDAGLYQKEAKAMVETWRDSWFEEGMRVLYLVPREFVDNVLPLEIAPRPREVARVFMGRTELLAPAQRTALVRMNADGDTVGFESFGRFFTAFARQVAKPDDPGAFMKFVIAKEQEIARRSASPTCVN